MTSILELLNSDNGKALISGASKQTGQSEEKTASVLGMALPVILGAMQRNSSTPEGAENLNKALEDKRHDGSIMNQLSGLLSGTVDSGLLSDGSGILSHVLGGKQQLVEQNISKATGVDAASVTKIIQMAAPIIMGLLGDQKRKGDVDQGGIGDLIGSVLGKGSSQGSMIESMLDGDGSILGDIAGMVLGGNNKKKKGGLGGLLGGLMGK